MLHDAALDRASATSAERRSDTRSPCPDEIVIAWLHDAANPGRYPLVDVSEGGFRIRCAVPLITGTTGIALRELPSGREIDQPIMIAWTRRREDGRYDMGLQRL